VHEGNLDVGLAAPTSRRRWQQVSIASLPLDGFEPEAPCQYSYHLLLLDTEGIDAYDQTGAL